MILRHRIAQSGLVARHLGTLLLIVAATAANILFSGALLAAGDQQNLQLDVIINDISAHMIGSFVLFDGKRMGATRNELHDVGLDIGTRQFPDDIVMLDDIPKLTYVYDEKDQSIRIHIDDTARRGQVFDLSRYPRIRSQSGWGAVFDYDFLGTETYAKDLPKFAAPDLSLSLDAHGFSPFGTIQQSALLLQHPGPAADVLRLDSTYALSDEERAVTARAGDIVTSGLDDNRPIRLAGVQLESNFALRPDLVTTPLPTLTGVAMVPSTVDLFINNTKTFTQDLAPGPFALTNVPLVSGTGNAQMVVTDASGHQTKTSLSFFASANLLAAGLNAWSLDAGLPRLSYGAASDDYLPTPIAAATFSRGVTDWLTLESHIEGGAGIVEGNFGAAFKTGDFGVATADLAASGFSRNEGLQAAMTFETAVLGVTVSASAQQLFGHYGDLAAVTARLPTASGSDATQTLFDDARPQKALDRITLGVPLPFDPHSSLGGGFIHARAADGTSSDIATISYARVLPFDVALSATVFHDFARDNTGFFAGLSLPFGDGVSVSTGFSDGGGKGSITTSAVRPLGAEPGDYGWTVQDSELGAASHAGTLSYRSNVGTIAAGADLAGTGGSATWDLRGSLVVLDGELFLSNWIDDGFGVVKAGGPGVTVFQDNRPVGVTDNRGLLLVPSLRSYERNGISIDPTNLPIDLDVATTSKIAVPARLSGVHVDFDVKTNSDSALVVLLRPDGSFVPAGSVGRIGPDKDFVVGYDGEAFIQGLQTSNSAVIALAQGSCRVSFAFTPAPGGQVRIGPLRCRMDVATAQASGLAAAPADGLDRLRP